MSRTSGMDRALSQVLDSVTVLGFCGQGDGRLYFNLVMNFVKERLGLRDLAVAGSIVDYIYSRELYAGSWTLALEKELNGTTEHVALLASAIASLAPHPRRTRVLARLVESLAARGLHLTPLNEEASVAMSQGLAAPNKDT